MFFDGVVFFSVFFNGVVFLSVLFNCVVYLACCRIRHPTSCCLPRTLFTTASLWRSTLPTFATWRPSVTRTLVHISLTSPGWELTPVCTWLVITVVKVFVECKILCTETILSAYSCTHDHTHAPTHTDTRTHKHSDYTKLKHSLKWAANRDLRWMKTAAGNKKHGRFTVLGK